MQKNTLKIQNELLSIVGNQNEKLRHTIRSIQIEQPDLTHQNLDDRESMMGLCEEAVLILNSEAQEGEI